jgi:hypothetical protein
MRMTNYRLAQFTMGRVSGLLTVIMITDTLIYHNVAVILMGLIVPNGANRLERSLDMIILGNVTLKSYKAHKTNTNVLASSLVKLLAELLC